ncbi:MAG TPA: matrixin family metalloprotease [Nitrososphaeraceae archaeon]|nr:matrixin family metalloprotease [Nitrososphaeraceae archaeon]
MALSSNSGDARVGSNPKDIGYSSNKRRNTFTYVGGALALLAVLSVAYLVLVLHGPFQFYNDLNRIKDYLPFNGDINDENEFDMYSSKEVVVVCCSWGEELADGELTYFIGRNTINRGENVVGDEVDGSLIDAVNRAIQEWDSRMNELTFTETSERRRADIEIYFRDGHNERAGLTKNYYDFYGLITKSYVLISKGAFGFGFSDSQIEQIAKHEVGHILGLGHANFDGNLMAVNVNHGSGQVSDCEIEAVYKANEWWFEKRPNSQLQYIQPPTTEYVECN